MASSVILQNHHHHNHHLLQQVNFNRNPNKNIIVNNNGIIISGGSNSSSAEFLARQVGVVNSGSGQVLQQQQQQTHCQSSSKRQLDGDVNKLEGVGSAPNSKSVVTRAILASKYLVQFEDTAITDIVDGNDTAGKQTPPANNNNGISNRNTPPQLPHVGPTKVPLKCMKLATKEVMQCKITLRDDRGVGILAAHQRLGECSDYVNPISELILHPKYFYLISPATYGNLHSYIYSKSSLKETEAKRLFKQMVSIVNFCHSRGVILRDLKLGRFVFTDKERTTIKLESLEDVAILPKPDFDDDRLDDRHGCPNYVSPEKTECVVRNGSVKYSGKSSDVWALGISLYAMLAGRYPFNESDCSRLLRKIRTCCYAPIDGISPFAKSLVRCLLAKNPLDRPSCKEILNHPWFRTEYPLAPLPQSTPIIRPYSISRDVDVIERECRMKRMRASADDDQVVPGS